MRVLLIVALSGLVAGYVDEEHDAVVIEAADSGASTRQGKQFWRTDVPTSPLFGQFVMPASTQLLATSQVAPALCKTTTGHYAWCQYQVPGIQGWPSPGSSNQRWQGGQTGGIQVGGGGSQFAGYPGVGGGAQFGGYPGSGGQFGGYPGSGGQFGGYPGVGGGGQFGGYPGSGGQFGVFPPGGGFPGAGGFPPGAGGQPGFPGAGGPPAAGGGAPPPNGPPPDNGDGVDTVGDVVDTGAGSGAGSTGECGVGRLPIRYRNNGSVAEELERIEGEYPFKVVNGWPAEQGEWPWIAALMNKNRQFCGGSLIDRKHILTAAHCVAHMSRYDVANLVVRLGEYNIKEAGETQIFESAAARVIRHKGFSQKTLHQDVAIISLKEEVPTSMSHISPVCLPSGHQSYEGETATVIGWGSIKENGPQPDVLQELTVKIWDNKDCKDTYGNAAPGGIEDHMLCAGQQGKDSCSGDSGGPMQIGTGNRWTQIGVVSWGIGCGKSHYPGVYSRVTELRDWIDKIVKDY